MIHPAPEPVPSSTPLDAHAADALSDRIASLAAHIHAAEHRLLVLIEEFDRGEGFGQFGFRRCAEWLSWRTGISPGPARERVRVARALAGLPRISEAMSQGRLSYSKVRALTRYANPKNEEEMLNFGLTGTAAHVERLVRGWRRVDRQEEASEERLRHEQRYLNVATDEHGVVRIEGQLDPEVGALLRRALEAADDAEFRGNRDEGASGAESPSRGGRSTPTQRRADAIGLIAEVALSAGFGDDAPTSRADRFQVMVHVQAEELAADAVCGGATLDGHQDVPAGTFRRLACDASRVVMAHDADGTPLSVGRRTRTVPPAIRRALRHRDGGCQFPGCHNRFADAHHIKHWADGGTTALDNLVLLCRSHHRAVHEGGYLVERTDTGDHLFTRPTGKHLPYVPDAPPFREGWNPEAPTAWRHTREGVVIDPWTAGSGWRGEPFDLGLALLWFRGLDASGGDDDGGVRLSPA